MDTRGLFRKIITQTSNFPIALTVDSASGSYIYDCNGNAYLDLVAGLTVNNVGHLHPKVVDAIQNQLSKYMHVMVYGEYIQTPQICFAKKILQVLPEPINNCYFVNTGTEANEVAIKIAKRYTRRHEIIAFEGAYHGSTQGAMSISSNESRKRAFRPLLPGVKFLPFNDIDVLHNITAKTACVIIELIQGDAGVRIANTNIIHAVSKKCQEVGALFVVDEIQTGMGRTGKLFAFEHYNIVPDIITCAKALGGGLPLGAVLSNIKYANTLSHNPALGHINTFGGNPLSCVAGLETLNILLEDDILDQVEYKGAYFEKLLSKHSRIKCIRRKGLMFAIDLENAVLVKKCIHDALKEGIILFFFLSKPSSFRMSPPLTISINEIDIAGKKIIKVLDRL